MGLTAWFWVPRLGKVNDVVRVELGSSILEGEMIGQAAAAAGLKVELMRNEHPETGALVALGRCALLVAADDEAALRRMLADFGY
jgi:hypothetical protein